WYAKKGQTFLIAEAGLSSSVTEDPDFSDKGGHGTIVITRTANAAHYSYVDYFTDDSCGLTVNGTVTGNGLFRLNAGRHGDPTPYLFDNYEQHIASTNPANGKWFREDKNGLYRDLHITNVGGTVYQFVSQETGRPYTLTASDGTRMFMDRGRLLTTFQVDTKGDADLSNDEFVDGSFQLLDEKRARRAYLFEGVFCDIVRDLPGCPARTLELGQEVPPDPRDARTIRPGAPPSALPPRGRFDSIGKTPGGPDPWRSMSL